MPGIEPCGGRGRSIEPKKRGQLSVGVEHRVRFWSFADGFAARGPAIDDACVFSRPRRCVVVASPQANGAHARTLCAGDVAAAQIADVDGSVGRNTESFEGGAKSPGIRLGYADFVGENGHLEELEQADALEQLPHDTAGRKTGVANEPAANAGVGQPAERFSGAVDGTDVVLEDLRLEGPDELGLARGIERDSQRLEGKMSHIDAGKDGPAMPEHLVPLPGISKGGPRAFLGDPGQLGEDAGPGAWGVGGFDLVKKRGPAVEGHRTRSIQPGRKRHGAGFRSPKGLRQTPRPMAPSALACPEFFTDCE